MTKALIRRASAAAVAVYACLVAAAVFFPLPGPGAHPPAQTIQLVPFQWTSDVGRELRERGLSIAHAITMPAFEGATLNVALFVPLGIFARLLWKRGAVGTGLLGFACSLLIETTQLSANWGTAPFQYRTFDVDDLIDNTTGALLGWVVGAVVLALWTSRVRMTNLPPARGVPLVLSDGTVPTRAAGGEWPRRVHPGTPAGRLAERPPVVRLVDLPRRPSRRPR
ncbi:VanZ family protein [Amycolatopsis pigmentata]|uniref:VanZ family protein n=1 Tax=Amycolatopsis pigmentata TaxID=450801 RepID=A0ABW5FUR2_9PSEU